MFLVPTLPFSPSSCPFYQLQKHHHHRRHQHLHHLHHLNHEQIIKTLINQLLNASVLMINNCKVLCIFQKGTIIPLNTFYYESNSKTT